MRYINTLILILIFGSLIGIGYFLYQVVSSEKSEQGEGSVPQVVSPKESTGTDDDLVTIQIEATVSGTLCYPSEFIPALDIYLVNKNTQEYMKQSVPVNTQSYKFDEVKEGTYVAFAYITGSSEPGGSYSQAVPCGLSVACTNHEPLDVLVSKGSQVADVNICDWYSPADIPARPE